LGISHPCQVGARSAARSADVGGGRNHLGLRWRDGRQRDGGSVQCEKGREYAPALGATPSWALHTRGRDRQGKRTVSAIRVNVVPPGLAETEATAGLPDAVREGTM
jgi:hypothetical protein